MMVLLHHASEGRHLDALLANTPAPIKLLVFDGGWVGVPIFFALSGFVIAHSLAHKIVDGRFLMRFIVRRSLRLDPPYWASILLLLAFSWLSARVMHDVWTFPGWFQLLSHATYTQLMTGVPQLGGVYWTLTYEIQFYLVLVVSAFVAYRLAPSLGQGVSNAVVSTVLFAIAVAWGTGAITWLPFHGLFVTLWASFFAGVLAYRAYTSWKLSAIFLPFVILMMVAGAPSIRFSALTALVLWAAGISGFLMIGLRSAWLQWLGAVSYSLYLTHNPVSGAAFFIARRLLPGGAAGEAAQLGLVIATCLAAATVMRLLVEAPSQNWAKTFGENRRAPAAGSETGSPLPRRPLPSVANGALESLRRPGRRPGAP
ncbi:acyltransferase [Sphingosinicellaceae bacterium]|nr:acyltransferase [Sphingosinicellaceae bacterium]